MSETDKIKLAYWTRYRKLRQKCGLLRQIDRWLAKRLSERQEFFNEFSDSFRTDIYAFATENETCSPRLLGACVSFSISHVPTLIVNSSVRGRVFQLTREVWT